VIPHPWPALVLVLAAYRWTRLGGWDDWPPIYRVRAWIIGETWVPVWIDEVRALLAAGQTLEAQKELLLRTPAVDTEAEALARMGVGGEPVEPSLPGKQPSSEADAVRPAYSRPTLAHLVHCPFCLGWWVSLATYVLWLALPDPWMMALAAPFALSGAVGLIAKNLDP
jgi:hypothetical protein